MIRKETISKSKPLILRQSDLLRHCDSVRALGEGQLESTTNDPHIYITSELARGYYLVRVSIDCDSTRSSTRIYYTDASDNSFREERSLRICTRPAEANISWTVLYLHKDSLIRFDPVDQQCTFRLNHLSLTPCSKRFARKIIEARLPSAARNKLDTKKDTLDTQLFEYYKTACESASGTRGTKQTLSYNEWLQREKYLLERDKRNTKSYIETLKCKPLISVILPAYNTPHALLEECIGSVLGQSYQNWELCISDDNSSDPEIRKILDRYEERDRRIRCVYREANGHISENSNSALKIAVGEFYAFLDHDDLLAEHALLYMVAVINKHPTTGILYSDEDKIDDFGNRLNPHFKPAFNFEMLLCQNYICHLLCIKSEIVRAVNGFDFGSEGCQDHILLIKCALECSRRNLSIVHIPVILYHWRMTKDSTALSASNKSYTSDNYIKSMTELSKKNIECVDSVVRAPASNTYQVIYKLPDSLPLVSILIPTRNCLDLVKQCYESILQHESYYPNFEIIIIDNNSDDPLTLDWFRQISTNQKTRVIEYKKEFNYSAINNFAARESRGDVLVCLNNDIKVITEDWLSLLVSHASRDSVGCVGAMLLFDDNTIQHAGIILGIGGVAGHSHKYHDSKDYGYHSRLCLTQEFSAVTAACLAVRKDIYHHVNGFNEVDLKVAFNDVDFCLRVQEAGYRNLIEPAVRLYHYESKSRGKEDTPEKQVRFSQEIDYMKRKWGSALLRDPFYNPNLTDKFEDFSIRYPSFSIDDLNLRIVSNYGI